MRALEKGLGVARAAPLAGLQRLLHLLAGEMVGKRGGIGKIVEQHAPVRCDERHAVGNTQTVQIGGTGLFQRERNALRLRAEPLERLIFIVAEHDGEEKNGADEQDGDADQKRISEYFDRHVPLPIL